MTTLSAVIPTRNRPDDLVKAVASVLVQTRTPLELIVIDQSPGDESARCVAAMMPAASPIRLVYVHDPAIAGLVAAKHAGSERAVGDVVCFLEDDVILEADYMEAIAAGFDSSPTMIGCSGIITNWPGASRSHIAVRSLFFRGIFHDPRLGAFAEAIRGRRELIPCDVLSGGLSAWRRHVFGLVPFDTRNGFFMFEDMEFSTRVVRALGHHLYINPMARLEHLWSPVNRDIQGTRQRRKLTEAMAFYKKRATWPGARHGLLLVLVWWLAEAARQSVVVRGPGPVVGYVRGLIDGLRKSVSC